MKMSDNNIEKNDFEKQIEDIDEFQKNATNPGYFIGNGKVPAPLKGIRRYPVVLIVLGGLGLAFSGLSLVTAYKSSSKVSELILPLIYDFVPFFISFILVKIGINEIINRNKKLFACISYSAYYYFFIL
jgi:hypothetical protein